VLFCIFDFVINYLTWCSYDFVFTENIRKLLVFCVDVSIGQPVTYPTTSMFAFISSRRHFCVFGCSLNLSPRTLSSKHTTLTITIIHSTFIASYLFIVTTKANLYFTTVFSSNRALRLREMNYEKNHFRRLTCKIMSDLQQCRKLH
jgi:hypothetical protein